VEFFRYWLQKNIQKGLVYVQSSINPWLAWGIIVAASFILTVAGTMWQLRRWED